ncbi:MAG: hypothetical protein B7C55_07020 [Actinomycetales bacterium mxb001]|nr:MAG: hypothetical protein B7C55_07020 [Actinomycetales bacterium mxb001]
MLDKVGLRFTMMTFDDFVNYLKKNPEDSVIWTNFGIYCKRLGQYDKAIYCHTKAIQINPNFAEAYNNRACAKKAIGDNTCLEDVYTAIRINPDFAEAYNNLGNIEHQLGLSQQAIEHYKKALLLGQRVDFYMNLAIVQASTGDKLNAINNICNALRITEDEELKARLRISLKELEAAVKL